MLAALASIACFQEDDWAAECRLIAPLVQKFVAQRNEPRSHARLRLKGGPSSFELIASTPVDVSGLSARLVRLERGVPPGEGEACLALFRKQADGAYKGEPLPTVKDGLDIAEPRAAVFNAGALFVAGLSFEVFNRPTAEFSIFRRRAATWHMTAKRHSTLECWSIPPLAKHRAAVSPLRLRGRGYPTNMDASMVAARAYATEQWSFRGDRIRLDWKRRDDTPYNRLDDLYGHFDSGDRPGAMTYFASEKLFFRAFSAYWVAFKRDGRPTVRFPGRATRDARTLGLTGINLWFTFERRHGKWIVTKLKPMD